MKLIRKSAIVFLPVLFCSAIAVQAEEESYYLEQMRNMAKNQQSKPSAEMAPARENTDLLADTDLQELSKPNSDFSSVGNIKPEFEKPKLDVLKPRL